MSEIIIDKKVTIGKIPEFNGKKYGKIQISSPKLADYVGKKVNVRIIIEVPEDVPRFDPQTSEPQTSDAVRDVNYWEKRS